MRNEVLDLDLWRRLPLDTFHTYSKGGVDLVKGHGQASQIHRPVQDVPKVILVKLSDAEKRLSESFTTEVLADGPVLVESVVGANGSSVGLLVTIPDKGYCWAHVVPDSVHLVNCEEGLPADSIVKPLYSNKLIRLFRIGPEGNDNSPHDVMMVTKARWFRKRANPATLGFAKEEKTK
jgi:hypothetical protein